MIDTVLGLPLHPLVVHAVVVLLPLMAIITVIVAARPRWRTVAAWPVVAANLVVLAFTVLAKESGEHLLRQMAGLQIDTHVSLGSKLPIFALLVTLASLLVAIGRQRKGFTTLAVVVTTLAAVVAVFWTLLTGHSGAESVWGS